MRRSPPGPGLRGYLRAMPRTLTWSALALLAVACRPASPVHGVFPGGGTGGDEGGETGSTDDTGEPSTGSGTGGDDTGGTGTDDTGGSGTDDTGTEPPPPPNVLILIADDFGLDLAAFDAAAPCYDTSDPSDQPVMPNLAGLCSTGVRFDKVWAHPTCSPTRASMLTGQSPWQHGVGGAIKQEEEVDGLDLDSLTLPRALTLAETGYALASFGKWHVSQDPGDPIAAGWPTYSGNVVGELESYDSYTCVEEGVSTTCDTYATTRTVDAGIEWLGGLEAETPWLLWVGFNAPHSPFHLPPEGLHTRTELTEYAEEDDARPWVVAMSEAMDTELGRLLEAVRERGEWEHTVVIFMGDNGTDKRAVADPIQPARAKGTLREGGIRVPFVVGGGAVEGEQRVVSHIVQVSDVYATVLELVGVDAEALRAEHAPDAPHDSVSFATLLEDPAASTGRTRVLSQSFPPGLEEIAEQSHAWSDGDMKIICRSSVTSLFDLDADPWESDDLLTSAEPATESLVALTTARHELEELMGVSGLCPYGEEDTGSAE